ncbi:MAG TPA: hypothetical protein VJ842_10760 [Pyrinomonadaceae bacterium]|nr:hypothetical protein [Pyrinomonadaceae bacterium]
MTKLNDFLAAFFPDEDEPIHFRAFKAKSAPDASDNRPVVEVVTRRRLATDEQLQSRMVAVNETRGWYFVVNAGGNADAEITRFNACFVENDELPIDEQHRRLDAAPLQPSIRLETRKSIHAYWLIKGTCDSDAWRDIQVRLIAYFNGDTANKNPSRVMRLPFLNHIHYDAGTKSYETKRVELGEFTPERRFTIIEMRVAFPVAAPSPPATPPNDGAVTFVSWDELNAELKRRIMVAGKQNGKGIYEARGICHDGHGETALMFNPATGAVHCNKGCDYNAILRAFGLSESSQSGDGKQRAGESERKQSQASRLVSLAAPVQFFHTPEGKGFASVPVGDHVENVSIKSGAFRDWLIREYRRTEGASPGAQGVQDALNDLAGTARFDSPEADAHTRLAENNGVIYLDLCNADWQVVRITTEGWSVLEGRDLPVRFRRTRGMLALPTPEASGHLSDLRRFINVRAEDWVLVAAWLVAAMRPGRPFPVLTLNGEQGSAKSTTARILRALVDPNKAALRSVQRDERELMIAATNGWIVALDNLSNIRSWLSDALCRLSTGGGFATRENYSDDDEVLFDAMRPVLLNGIDELATRSDLLDRAIIVTLPTITEENRREEADVWREFDEARPRLLGALLSALSTALRNLPHVKLDRLPRMADFARFAVAAEPALDCVPGSFLSAYTRNRTAANELALEASPIATVLLAFVSEVEKWRGTAGELLKKLNELAGETTQAEGWAKSAQSLGGTLKRLAPNLRASGVDVKTGVRMPGSGKRLIILEKTSKQASHLSQPPQAASSQAENCDNDDRDHDGSGEALSHPEPNEIGMYNERDECDNDLHGFSSSDDLSAEEAELAARLEYDEHLPRAEAERRAREWFAPVPF